MPLAITRRTGLVDQVIDQLRAVISEGEWPIGVRIPTEAALAETLGVGRNTVREAIRALVHGGQLEVRRGDGTYVRATSEVSGAIRRLCGSELREILQVRRGLEVEGARLAALARTDEDLHRLTELLTERNLAQQSKQFDAFVRADTEFHLAIVHSGHNALLAELYRGIVETVSASVAATSHDHLAQRVHIGHDGLLEAIGDRDPDRAAAEAGGFLDQLIVREESGSPRRTR